MSTPVDPSGLTPIEQRPQSVTQPQAVEANILLTMLNNVTVTTNSAFCDIRNFSKFALEVIQVSGGGTFSLQLVGSCASEQPAATTSGANLGSAITGAGITFPALAGVRWVQAQITISGTATINVNLSAVAP